MTEIASQYFNLLREAYEAHVRADMYDLHSEKPESVCVYESWREREREAQVAFVAFCNKHAPEIAASFVMLWGKEIRW